MLHGTGLTRTNVEAEENLGKEKLIERKKERLEKL
jgi:hypothetical protein